MAVGERFDAYIVANFTHKVGSNVPDFIMADGREAFTWTTQGMMNTELFTADAGAICSGGCQPYRRQRHNGRLPCEDQSHAQRSVEL